MLNGTENHLAEHVGIYIRVDFALGLALADRFQNGGRIDFYQAIGRAVEIIRAVFEPPEEGSLQTPGWLNNF